MTKPFTVADIRKSFLDFFEKRGHSVVASSPLVPNNDPTLMFTNSGMVQFKDVFLGTDRRPYSRASTVQTCLRAGGKHNDLENVGYTARHHTFFEMLGNWSFGDYFKKESIEWGWELLTKVYGLPAEKLLATVYHEDDEAFDIWTKVIGLPPERVIRIGDNKGGKYKSDNFWMMADTGPCGPCSEIFYDHGEHIAGGPPGSPDEDGDRFIEIWNHVFMQFDMAEDGTLSPLPAPCVDTGMGLERLAAILQNVHSNYEIDLFQDLMKAAANAVGIDAGDLSNPSLKVIADHIRAAAFLVADGVVPSSEGRGYVQRRIIRRAIRHGYKLGCKKPFFNKLVPSLVELMGAAYPRLAAEAQRVQEALKAEEERFFETLDIGMSLLDDALISGKRELAGHIAFKLHDTYGFPLDLTQDVCRERGVTVDVAGFDEAMNRQKEQARAAGKFKMERGLDYTGAPTDFVGYTELNIHAKILAIYPDEDGQAGASASILRAGQTGTVVLDKTPFYAESGGQVGDTGTLAAEGVIFGVTDTQKIKANVFGHHGKLIQGELKVGDTIHAKVNEERRAAIMRNHSVTHIMHKALREVLGAHVQQKGSLVDQDKTRFDFAHNAPVTQEQRTEIERRVNEEILNNATTNARIMDIKSAEQTGAMMLFGEKYGETVRVLDIGTSRELCGGTHVRATGDIGMFKIISESGVAAGVRRLEAITGANTLTYLQGIEASGQSIAATLRTTLPELQSRILQMLEQSKEQEKEIAALKSKLATSGSDEILSKVIDIDGIKVLAARMMDGTDAKTLRETMDHFKNKLGEKAAIVLSVVDGEKVQIAAGVTKDLIAKIKAGELANHVAAQVGGKGGGKPDMAMAGGTKPSELPKALESVKNWIKEKI